jgi:hypothetical protein
MSDLIYFVIVTSVAALFCGIMIYIAFFYLAVY